MLVSGPPSLLASVWPALISGRSENSGARQLVVLAADDQEHRDHLAQRAAERQQDGRHEPRARLRQRDGDDRLRGVRPSPRAACRWTAGTARSASSASVMTVGRSMTDSSRPAVSSESPLSGSRPAEQSA